MPSPSFTEFATIRNGKDITRGFVEFLGNFIPTQDTLLLEKSGGQIDLYEKVLQDDRVRSCYQQRFSGLTSKEIEILPGGKKRIDKQAAEHIQKQLEKINWDDITEKMSYGIHYGYSIAECIYDREDDKIILADIRVRNRRRFHFGYDMEPKLKTFGNPLGEDLPAQKFWHFRVGADNHDEPYGLGLGHWLYWLTWFKRNDLKWWVTFLENFADPSTIGHYPAGATLEQKRTLQGAVQNIGKSKWATLPEGMLIELLEASRSGTADYQGMHDSLNTAISTLILSQSMTSESGSSEAQATVHKDVGDTVIEADDALISSSFNASVVTWLTNWNFPGAAIPRVRRKLEPPDDLKALADRDAVIVGLGFPLNPDYVLKTYGEGFAAIEGVGENTSLNAGELTAFIQMVTTAQSAGWSPDLVQASLQIAFPHVPTDLLDKLAKGIKASPLTDPNADPNADPKDAAQPPAKEPTLDDVASQFAESLDEVALQFELEFKLKEGTTKEVNGKQYVLTKSRWRRADTATKTEKKPKAATSKPLTEVQKQKKEKVVKSASTEAKSKEKKPKAEIQSKSEPFREVEKVEVNKQIKKWEKPQKVAESLARQIELRKSIDFYRGQPQDKDTKLFLAGMESELAFKRSQTKIEPDLNALQRYVDSANISDTMIQYGATGGVMRGKELLAAYDHTSRADSIYVYTLAVNPRAITEPGFKSGGAGTQAIKQLVQISIDEGLKGKITLEPVDAAKGFYEKLGFKPSKGKPKEWALSSVNAKKLIKG